MGFATTSGRPLAGANPEPQADAEITEIAAAEQAYEDASANGDPQSIDTAHRRLMAARAAAEQAQAAARGRERQAHDRAEREREQREADKRVAFLRWAAEWARRAAPAIALREQLAEAEAHVKTLGLRPSPFRNRSEAVDAGLYAGMPDGVQACARAIPDAPTVPTDITRATRRSETGHPMVIQRISGDDRYQQLADAIGELADRITAEGAA